MARYKQDIRRSSKGCNKHSLTDLATTKLTLMIRNQLLRYYSVSSIMSAQQTMADVTSAGLS